MSDNADFISLLVFIILFVILTAGGVIYYYFAKTFRYGQIRKAFDDLIQNDGFQPVAPEDPLISQLTRRIRSFDDPILTNVTVNVREAAFKKADETDIYLNYYEWEKTRTYIVQRRGREYRETEVELHLRAGVYVPVQLGVPRMYVRGRLDDAGEEKMETAHGIPTPPDKGIPDFDRYFVCKGPNSVVVGKLMSLEVQKAILAYVGNYPLVPGDFMNLVMYFDEQGMNITMEKALKTEQYRSLIEFSLLLLREIRKTREVSGEGDEEIYKMPEI